MRTVKQMAAVALVSLGVTACGGDVAKNLGLTPTPPDEFQVVRKAPLSLPPSYALRPPAPGSQRPQELVPTESAKKTVFRLSDRTQSAVGPLPEGADRGKAAFLARAGAAEANPNIRTVLQEDDVQIATANRTFLDTLLFWRDEEITDRTLLDADAEQRRLKENAAAGRGADEGDNPIIIERSSTSIFNF
ncbi:MAG: DUF3035 domain-containing protein [Alphaproteobacteria bacterium]|nr:DUF3035 domain-containing protein [Alphaproteobacteria bacterium]